MGRLAVLASRGLSDLAGLVVGTQLTRCFTSGTCQSSSFAEKRGLVVRPEITEGRKLPLSGEGHCARWWSRSADPCFVLRKRGDQVGLRMW